MKPLARHWLKFNLVSALGVAVQLGAIALLSRRMDALIATPIAVEIAVLHNFFWHDRFTWKDRPGDTRERLMRLLRFHLGNGLVSQVGNEAGMWLLVRQLHMKHIVIAN